MSESLSTRAESGLLLRLFAFAAEACGSVLRLLTMLPSSEASLMSPERTAHLRQHEPQFLRGPQDGATEAEVRKVATDWGVDCGVAWIEVGRGLYVFNGRHWQWCWRSNVKA